MRRGGALKGDILPLDEENVELSVKSNKIREIIAYSSRTVALTFASSVMIQTFLSSLGFTTDLIYTHSTLLQAANVITILLFSKWAENGSPMKRAALTAIPLGIL